MLKINQQHLALFEESSFDLILTDINLHKFRRYKSSYQRLPGYPRKSEVEGLYQQNFYNKYSNNLFWMSSPFSITMVNLNRGKFTEFDIYSSEFIMENLPYNLKVVGTSRNQIVVLTALRKGLFICYHYQNERGGVTEIYKIEDCILGSKID